MKLLYNVTFDPNKCADSYTFTQAKCAFPINKNVSNTIYYFSLDHSHSIFIQMLNGRTFVPIFNHVNNLSTHLLTKTAYTRQLLALKTEHRFKCKFRFFFRMEKTDRSENRCAIQPFIAESIFSGDATSRFFNSLIFFPVFDQPNRIQIGRDSGKKPFCGWN